MIDPFAELIQQLGQELGTTLHSDKRGACKLKINDLFHVQLEPDAGQEHLLMATFICDLPPGKLKENILRDALKANSPFPHNGTLAYSERNNKLTLFESLPLRALTGAKLTEILLLFVDKANNWRIGVETGHTAHLVSATTKPTTSIFDVKPHG